MKFLLFQLAILVGWLVLNVWVLPKFGVSTCLSGSCGISHDPEKPDSVGEDVKASGLTSTPKNSTQQTEITQ